MIYLKANKKHEILEWPLFDRDLRQKLRDQNISAPPFLDQTDLTHLGYYQVDYVKPPAASKPGVRVVLDTPHWDGYKFVRRYKEEPIAKTWDEVRALRTKLLAESDWTQLPDSPLSKSQIKAWASYRQALRDLPNDGDAADVEWPAKPE